MLLQKGRLLLFTVLSETRGLARRVQFGKFSQIARPPDGEVGAVATDDCTNTPALTASNLP